jgi:ubiquinone biosynthesis protein UbiJ
MAGFERLIVPALNHLIQKESWAKERLRPFSGAQLQISAGAIQIQLSIDECKACSLSATTTELPMSF